MKTPIKCALISFLIFYSSVHLNAQKIITYDVTTGVWNPSLKKFDVENNENVIVKISCFNPLKYDVTLSYNGKEYTSDIPPLFANAFDPSALSGMIDNATGLLHFKGLNKSTDDSITVSKNKAKIFSTNDAVKQSMLNDKQQFEKQLNDVVTDVQKIEKDILSNLNSLKNDNSILYLDILQNGLLPEKLLTPVRTFSYSNSDTDYTSLTKNINLFNSKMLELVDVANLAATPDNVKKLKAETQPSLDFLTQLKPELESEVSNYYNLKTQAIYFNTTMTELQDGVELHILSVNDADQLDIDVELTPKNMELNYKMSSPSFYNFYSQKDNSDTAKAVKTTQTTNSSQNSKSTDDDKTKTSGCCPTVVNVYSNGNKSTSSDKTTGTDKTVAKKEATDTVKKQDSPVYLIHKYRIPKQTISIPIKGKGYFSYSTGFYHSWLRNESYTWQNLYAKDSLSKDSVKLVKENVGNHFVYDLGIISQLHCVLPSLNFDQYNHHYNFAVGFDIGAAINLPDLRLRYSGGVSLIFGTKNQFIISGGTMVGQVDKLSNAYSQNMVLRSDLKPSDIYVRIWDMQGYLSISYGFRYIKKATNNNSSN